MQNALDDERVARLEREAQTLKQAGDDICRLQEKIESERVDRESSFGIIHDFQSSINGIKRDQEKFQNLLIKEIAQLKTSLQVGLWHCSSWGLCTKEREK